MSTAAAVRPRLLYLTVFALVIPLGLFTRSESAPLPEFVRLYGGDTLWAVMFFLSFAVLMPKAATWRILLLAAVCVYGLEFLQLADWPWLGQLRKNRAMGFLLGTTFMASDVVCLSVGLLMATVGDVAFLRWRAKT